MNIRDAMDRIVAIQEAMTISDAPIDVSVKTAWKYVPPQSTLMPELPAWTNSWTLIREDRFISMRVQIYTVQMQLFVAKLSAEDDVSFDIATAFMTSIVDDFDADVSLNGTVTEARLRGGPDTLAILDRGGDRFAGLDLFLDLEMKEGKNFA